MPDLSDQIEQAAADPSAVSVDGQSVTDRPIGDIIQADQYLAQKPGRKRNNRGLMFTKLVPPGPVSDVNGTGGVG